uniref:Large ribosomal subunit protein mL40 n=1 Tax=Mantoniella antarctica TaxID=81844 RepID=A0A6U3I300_9CHLO|mmetsp:Transcript_21443/g.34703  ORF Transcript_21443/g.34703 Transcript_21443/m.34703 type:complete len:240 (-) Transcript_21443:428-1147(-)
MWRRAAGNTLRAVAAPQRLVWNGAAGVKQRASTHPDRSFSGWPGALFSTPGDGLFSSGRLVGLGASPSPFGSTRHYAKKAGKQQKRTGGVIPQAPTNPGMKRAVENHFAALMEAMTPLQIPKENLTAEQLEEYEARAKEYSRKKMAQHRAWQVDIDNKIRHKRAAMAALPAGFIQDAAMLEDHALFPMKRVEPQATPNIKGYAEEKLKRAEQAAGAAKKSSSKGRSKSSAFLGEDEDED